MKDSIDQNYAKYIIFVQSIKSKENNDLGHLIVILIQQLLLLSRHTHNINFTPGWEHNNLVQEHEPRTYLIVISFYNKKVSTATRINSLANS